MVNAIAPVAIVDTGAIAKLNSNNKKALRERIPLKRLSLSIDVAKAILFLAENNFVTGQTIDVNGGLWMG